MTDTTVGDLVKQWDEYVDSIWPRKMRDCIDALAAKLAEAERVARYESDIAQQALDQMKAEKARADAAEAKLAKVEEDRDDLQITLASARKQLERYIAEAEQRVATLEAALPAVYRLAWEDAYQELSFSEPTAAKLMARIQTGEKE